jgi:hypothetical protein
MKTDQTTQPAELGAAPCSPRVPWMMKPLDEWAIVGMNHYHIGGEKRLFVAMTKSGRCIVEEGPDDKYLWNRLWHKATSENKQI